MAWRGTDDLRGYLKDAVLPALKYGPDLPTLPPSLHKSHRNILSTRFKKSRHLTSMYCLNVSFDKVVNKWINTNVPDRSLGIQDKDQRSGEQLTVPSSWKFRTSSAAPAPVTDFSRLWSWVDHFPFQTVQRILHIILPDSKDWTFVSEIQPHCDDHIFKEFYFTDVTSSASPKKSVVVACQPPWVLSDEDMWQFTELRTLPNSSQPLRAKERLWGKLWDICVRKGCYYFILTSYQQWAFGAFSDGWTNAFVSPPLDAQAREPTVLQAMLYWLASALEVKGGFQTPGVPEPVCFKLGHFSAPSSTLGDMVSVQDSMSSWQGKNEDAASSAHAAELAPLDVSEKGITRDCDHPDPITYIKPRDPATTRQMIEQWRSQLPSVRTRRRRGQDTQESTTLRNFFTSDLPQVSQLTTDLIGSDDVFTTASSDHPDVGDTTGHWLAS